MHLDIVFILLVTYRGKIMRDISTNCQPWHRCILSMFSITGNTSCLLYTGVTIHLEIRYMKYYICQDSYHISCNGTNESNCVGTTKFGFYHWIFPAIKSRVSQKYSSSSILYIDRGGCHSLAAMSQTGPIFGTIIIFKLNMRAWHSYYNLNYRLIISQTNPYYFLLPLIE